MSKGSVRPPAIALIGCGAIAEAFHLPALIRHAEILPRLILVDSAVGRAAELAKRHGVGDFATDHRDVLDRVDGVIIAAPPQFHHPVSLDCLNRGVHVLCEKPLCEDAVQARELVETAERCGAVLAVNQTRRLFPAFQQVRELLAAGAIGRPTRLDYWMGEPFDWPAVSDSYFGARGSGKGVVLDTGAHIIDLVTWWLGGRPRLVDYRDDSFGGTEAVAQLDLDHDGCRVSIHLSWLSKLQNTYRIQGEAGSISGEVYEWASLTLRSADGRVQKIRTEDRPSGFEDFSHRLIDNFLAVVRDGAKPLVPGREVLPSIEIIDECYGRRRRFELPWIDTSGRSSMPSEPRVLVTGAGGFIGGRIVEMLHLQRDVQVRAGVRRWGSAARIGRFPVDIAQFDLRNPTEIARALEGVSAVVHCAVGDREVTVRGTENLLAAAQSAGVERFVHISTIDVYGDASGDVDEGRPLSYSGREYGDAKIDAEKACEAFAEQGLPVVVLRPTLVYGPFSASWTIEWAERLQSPPWLLAEQDCEGICNLVYVDDLVTAVWLAMQRDEAVGQAYNINGPERPTWNAYFRALNDAMGLPALRPQSAATSHLSSRLMAPVRASAKFLLAHFEEPIMKLYQRSAAAKAVMRTAERVIKRTPTAAEFGLLDRTASFPTAKAQAQLGYVPRFAMADGVALSVAWLRHHGYIRNTTGA